MKSVKVFVYSYKNKNLLDQINDMISKQSGLLDVHYYVFDQNNVDRGFHFKDIDNVTYKFVRWDDYKSKTYYRNMVILNENISNYFLEIDPNISIMGSWDIYLSSVLKTKGVISGKGLPQLSVDRHLVSVNYIKSEQMTTVNYIDSNFIFLRVTDAMALTSLNILKDIGQNLFATAILMSKGYSIDSLPSSAYTTTTQDNYDTYVPYSIIHGYNKMLEVLQGMNNTSFEDFHGIKLSKLTKMPYEINDVDYLHFMISLDNLEVPRFLSGYRGVQIL